MYSAITECIFSGTHEKLSMIDHTLGYETSLDKYKNIESYKVSFFITMDETRKPEN